MIEFKLKTPTTFSISFEYNQGIVGLCQMMKGTKGLKWDVENKHWWTNISEFQDVYDELGDYDSTVDQKILTSIEKVKKEERKVQAELADIDTLKNYTGDLTIPGLNATLFEYQKKDVYFMSKKKRALNGNEMGLGKTLETISTCLNVGFKKILIVAPTTLKHNWIREIEKFTNESCVMTDNNNFRTLLAKIKLSRFVVVHYEMMRKYIKEIIPMGFDCIVCDEAHKIKNKDAKLTQAVKQLKPEGIFLLTGTPIMNRPEELWSLLNYLDSSRFSNYWNFVRNYSNVVKTRWGYEISGLRNAEELHKLLNLYMCRNLKKDVLKDLPEKLQYPEEVEMHPDQKKAYASMRDDFKTWYERNEDGDSDNEGIVLAKLIRLKQMAVLPQMVGSDAPSSKMDRLAEIADELCESDRKIIVFSQFKEVVRYVHKLLLQHGVCEITGDTPLDVRDQLVQDFRTNPNKKVFVATVQSCGLGLTLTEASVVIHVDKIWNPQLINQANDRAHRIGQKNTVHIISLIARGTIDETIEDKLFNKEEMFNKVVEGKDIDKISTKLDIKDVLTDIL